MLAHMSLTWEGVYCALWTPTDKNGLLLESALQDNIEFLKARGVRGLLVLGSTGEFLHLKPSRRKDLFERTAECAGALQLIMNISDIRPDVVQSLAKFAKRAGAGAVSVLPPYFYPVAQEDLAEFFVRAGEAAQLPLFIYNFPERTGNRIALETIADVADKVPVAGVKQSGGEFDYHLQLIELGRRKGFVVLTGADTRLPEAVAAGVSGCVSGLSNAVPELVVEAFNVARQKAVGDAQSAAGRMKDLGKKIGVVQFPLDVAACMEARGLAVGAPKQILSQSTSTSYSKLVEELRATFREWKLI